MIKHEFCIPDRKTIRMWCIQARSRYKAVLDHWRFITRQTTAVSSLPNLKAAHVVSIIKRMICKIGSVDERATYNIFNAKNQTWAEKMRTWDCIARL